MRARMSRGWSAAVGAAVALAGLALAGVVAGGPAQAMGSGDAFEDLQVGVTYTVYEPSWVAGLRLQHAGGNSACPEGVEENLLATYGKASRYKVSITEGNPMCSDIGVGQTVLTTTVRGAKATVVAYCDPESTAPCTRADVRRFGGHLQVALPAAQGLRPTTVWIETFGTRNLSAAQLVRIARSMAPVG